MTSADFERSYFHPEYKQEFRLAEALGLYAHHCRHHPAQIAWVRDQRR
jgi:pterin-4a-carbinolamine dehydratase